MFKRKAKRIPAERSVIPVPEPLSQKGFGTEMPPDKRLVEIYFDQKELIRQAGEFFDFYEAANWSSPKGTRYRNWKLLAADWIFDYQQSLKLRQRQFENAMI